MAKFEKSLWKIDVGKAPDKDETSESDLFYPRNMAKFEKSLWKIDVRKASDKDETSESDSEDNEHNPISTSNEVVSTRDSSCSSDGMGNKVFADENEDEDEDGESSECDSDGFYFHVPLPEDKGQTSSCENKASCSYDALQPSSCENKASCSYDALQPKLTEVTFEDKGKVISFDDVYFDISKKRTSTNDKISPDIDTIMKKSVIGPGFEKLKHVPPDHISKKMLQRERQMKRLNSKGEMWFNMPKVEITPELKQDLQVLKMRSVLDPKQFYKKNVMKEDPKYFHVGTVVESPIDFYSSRIPKKQRKRTMVEELLADAEFQSYNKQRYKEIITERKRTSFKAFKHAKRLKRNKVKGRK